MAAINMELNIKEVFSVPKGLHDSTITIPIDFVWSFVSNMNNWAPLVPGYMEHEIINDRESTWKFKGDIGIVQKTVHLKIEIIKWEEPTKVTFQLTGLSENFKGNGYFLAKELSGRETEITGCLDITAKGMMAPVVNPILKSFIPKTTKEFTESVVDKMANDMRILVT